VSRVLVTPTAEDERKFVDIKVTGSLSVGRRRRMRVKL
jgi:hypothetical protein